MSVWDVASGSKRAALPLADVPGRLTFVGEAVLAVQVGETAKFWNFETHETWEWALAGDDMTFSPDRTLAASLDRDDSGLAIHLFDAASGDEQHTLRLDQRAWFRNWRFSPDGTLFAFTITELDANNQNGDSYVKIWNLHTGNVMTLDRANRNLAFTTVFNPGGDVLAIGDEDGRLELWDARTGVKLAQLCEHHCGHGRLLFTPDGRRLISSSDGAVRLWGLPGGA